MFTTINNNKYKNLYFRYYSC